MAWFNLASDDDDDSLFNFWEAMLGLATMQINKLGEVLRDSLLATPRLVFNTPLEHMIIGETIGAATLILSADNTLDYTIGFVLSLPSAPVEPPDVGLTNAQIRR